MQPLKILQTVAARQVQHDQRHDHLKIEPALLPGDPDMLANRDIQPAGLDQIQVDRQSAERRHPAGGRLGFVLERQPTLCHASVTPLVMAPCFATTAYPLDSSRPTGNLIILDPDLRPTENSSAQKKVRNGSGQALFSVVVTRPTRRGCSSVG